MLKKLLPVLLVFCMALPALAAEWYEGGTLHKGTIRQWHAASPQNKVATTADFVAATSNEAALRRAGMKQWQAATFAVTICIDEGTAGVEELMSQPIAAVSTMCMSHLKKDYPFLLSK